MGSWGSSKIILAQLRQLLQDLRVAMVSTGKAPSCHLLEQSAAGNGRVPSPLTSSLAGGSAHRQKGVQKLKLIKNIQKYPNQPTSATSSRPTVRSPAAKLERRAISSLVNWASLGDEFYIHGHHMEGP